MSKYRNVIAKYPKAFLESLPTDVYEKYFSMGTYDEVQLKILEKQKFFLQQFKAGFVSEEELNQFIQGEIQKEMPFLEQ